MVGGRIADDTLWACTTCGACQEVCPVFIEHPLKILEMRQHLVLAAERVPSDLARTFRNIERQSNPWGIANDKRMDWADGLDVPTIEDNPDPDYILWIGCAGAFDQRITKQTKALVKVLGAAGVNFAVLGHAESCTGDPARRAGNEMLFQMQAEANVEVLNEARARVVIASCPHCLHTLRHDYPQFGGNFEVVHHTQLLAALVADGKIVPEKQVAKSVTYHDSCYLGRWNGEFDAPRAVLDSLDIPRGTMEPERRKQHGMCCGAGGARMFMEEDGPRVNENRTDELMATGAETIAVACPFCNIMITDGVKARDAEEKVSVMDVSELLASSLPDVPASSLVRRPPA
jgi:Fe-S oxidoreductase